MNRIILGLIGLLVFPLTACTKTVLVPTPVKEPDPAEDSVFSTLDFATPKEDVGRGLAVNGSNLYVVGYTGGDLDGPNQGLFGGTFDGILRRYNGFKLWGLQFGTRESDRAYKVATDSNGNIYVVGRTDGPLGFQVGHSDTFLAKFNQDGELLWGKQFGTKSFDFAIDLAIDSNNRIYVLSDEGQNNFVIRKFSSGGNLLKMKSVTLNNRPSLAPKAITVDSLNNLIVLTEWDNSGNARGKDIRLFKYASDLSQVWQKPYNTANDDLPYDVTTDSNNNIYFTIRIDAVNEGAYFVKKRASGATLYTKRLEYSPTSSNTILKSITTDSNNNIYIAGHTGGSFSGFSNAGFNDIVVFKYNSSGTQQWINQFGNGNYGSAGDDLAFDIAVSSTVYITGYTTGNLLTGDATSYGSNDAYVAQLNKSNGTIIGIDQ